LRYLFEDYAFDTDRRELYRGADVVTIAPQVFDLLDYLIRNRERVVSKEDLINAIWNGRIVSDAALTTRLNVARSAIGDSGHEQRLIKTLPRKGFRFVGPVREVQKPAGAAIGDSPVEPAKPTLTLPDKPSIAVLPFQNMSGDPEQEYFADGMVEEIITVLSRFKWLFVIARNSSFAYKGRAVDVKQVGRELGIRYVLEGSVRKSRNRVRITGQLVDAITGAHLWADRFDASLENVFDLQDSVASTVAGEIAPRLERAEIERAKRKPTGSLDAYDNYLRGIAIIPHAADRESTLEAQRFFYSAIEHDPNFASAHAWAAYCYAWLKVNGYATIGNEEIAATLRHVTKAAEWGQDDAVALGLSGLALAYIGFDLDGAVSLIDRALTLNPNLAAAWHWSGWVSCYRGEPEKAIEHLARAMRLSPLDPFRYGMQAATALAEFFAGRYDQAMSWADKACLARPQFAAGWTIAAASNALAGDLGKAQRAAMRLLQINPAARVSLVKYRIPLRRSEDLARFEEGLRKAGLPE
jgi:TolB-like protein/Tfp pilus assembly protein PilF